MSTTTEPARLVGLLADGARLRVVAALALGSGTLTDIIATSGLGAREAVDALARLTSGGLVVGSGAGPYVLLEAAFADAARHAAMAAIDDDPLGPSVDTAELDEPARRVLQAFVRDGRLTSLPTQRSKRRIVLDLIAQDFEPGLRYSEPDVNAIVGRWHDDYAAIRRWLVDEGFLARASGTYWRMGGSVPQVVGS